MPTTARKHQLSRSLLYHVYNRGNAGADIFHKEMDYCRFIEILCKYSIERNIQIYHWVLMPNHYHLLLEIAEPERLSSIMSGIARSYVYHHHNEYNSYGYLWQGRFKSQPIEKESYLLSCGRYIENNPVKANMVKYPQEYCYSSAKYYLLGAVDKLTREDPLFVTFGDDLCARRNQYLTFMKKYVAEEDAMYEDTKEPRGSAYFLERLVRKNGLYLPRRRGRPLYAGINS